MKPTTEDFLIPMADIMRIFDIDDIKEAAKIRIRAAIDAKAAHDEECQRLADEWVEANKAEFLAEFESYRSEAVQSRYPHGHKSKVFLDHVESRKKEMWAKTRSVADSMFRDYISEQPPTQ